MKRLQWESLNFAAFGRDAHRTLSCTLRCIFPYKVWGPMALKNFKTVRAGVLFVLEIAMPNTL